jgi:hypothetical protein
MSELDLVGLHEDGERLVLRGASGERYTVRIDEALRAAVRRDRPQLEHLRAQGAGALPVREIQARIRSGLSAEQVAEESGVPVEHIRRYEGPVLAEREHVVTRARATALGPDGSPALDDLVADRLAARGVDPQGAGWDSSRDAHGSWSVTLSFEAGGAARVATWGYDAASRSVRALDDEARWLSETEIEADPVRRTLTAASPDAGALDAVVRPVLAAVDERASWPDALATDAILDDLERRRGQRPKEDDEADDEADEPSGSGASQVETAESPGDAPTRRVASKSAHLIALPLPVGEQRGGDADQSDAIEDADATGDPDATAAGSAGSAGSSQAAATDAARTRHPAGAALHPGDHARRGGRRPRTKIPSWDEIMFGQKPEK